MEVAAGVAVVVMMRVADETCYLQIHRMTVHRPPWSFLKAKKRKFRVVIDLRKQVFIILCFVKFIMIYFYALD